MNRRPIAILLLPACLALAARAFPQDDADPGHIGTAHERTADQAETTYATMKPVAYAPPPGRWDLLPRTRQRLKEGGELKVVMLGDSIVNDTARSSWDLLLPRLYPGVTVRRTLAVRGSTGCWWFRGPGRVKRFVLDHDPDLVMIGGISHHDDAEAVRDVVRQVRDGSRADILLMSGPFGFLNPLDEAQWKKVADPPPGDYRRKLPEIAAEAHAAYLDLQLAWGEYVRASGRPDAAYRRDPVHANAEGEQVLGHILLKFFAPGG